MSKISPHSLEGTICPAMASSLAQAAQKSIEDQSPVEVTIPKEDVLAACEILQPLEIRYDISRFRYEWEGTNHQNQKWALYVSVIPN